MSYVTHLAYSFCNMKLRNFKKAIHRVGYYKYRVPKILSKIEGYDDGQYIYYECHKLKCKIPFETTKFVFTELST